MNLAFVTRRQMFGKDDERGARVSLASCLDTFPNWWRNSNLVCCNEVMKD